MYQATPTIERTRNGRLWAAWVSGGPDEGPFNYVILSTSEDGGNTWSDAKLVIDPPGNISASNPRLWRDDSGRLWALLDASVYAAAIRGHVWAIVADNPESASPTWSPPTVIADGNVGGKPVIVKTGQWLLPVYVGSGACTTPTCHVGVIVSKGAFHRTAGP